MADPYESFHEENKAITRTYILFMEGRFEQLSRLGFMDGGVTRLTDKGREEFERLTMSGFIPNRERLEDILYYVGDVHPNQVGAFADLMIDYDWLLKEMKDSHDEGF